jgi:hypothetical protein
MDERLGRDTTTVGDATSSYPQTGGIACTILGTTQRDGRKVVRVDTQMPARRSVAAADNIEK